jgi:hypothetical protein
MFTKIISGPDGYYAFCADKPIAIGMWSDLAENLGPRRDNKDEAEHDIIMMSGAITTDDVIATNPFANLSTPVLTTLVSIAKQKRRGVYPWFRHANNMIALRDELDRRTK